jgi:hypothetical protein
MVSFASLFYRLFKGQIFAYFKKFNPTAETYRSIGGFTPFVIFKKKKYNEFVFILKLLKTLTLISSTMN